MLALLGRGIFPNRLLVGLAVVVVTAWFMRGSQGWGWNSTFAWTAGPLLLLVGFGLRAWASGCAGLHTRKNTLNAPQLVTGGPFAYVRNPIYLGTALLGLGVIAILGEPWLLGPWALAMGLLYGTIIPAEERHLKGQFGEVYDRYCAEVPRLIPRLRRWRDAGRAPFRWAAAAGEATLIVIVGFIIIGLHWIQTP